MFNLKQHICVVSRRNRKGPNLVKKKKIMEKKIKVCNILLIVIGIGFVLAFAAAAFAEMTGNEVILALFPRACTLLSLSGMVIALLRISPYNSNICNFCSIGGATVLLGGYFVVLSKEISIEIFGILGGTIVTAGALLCIIGLLKLLRKAVVA